MIDFAAARVAMVDCQIRPSDVTLYPVIEAMLSVPKEEFVPRDMREVAYSGDNIALGPNRVVLDSRVIAKMLDVLNIQPSDLVLDIGTGLGYSSALIAHLAEAVIAVEENEALAAEAERILAEQSADNAIVQVGKLADGAPQHGPYDAIMVEGGVEQVPDALLAQLKVGGRIVAIHMQDALGQCRVGLQTRTGIDWRWAFDASAPVLPGFEKPDGFQF
ncbi:MAG: protein-L-isoaspartate O-methyltransferase [Rhodobacteraceae bacterium]|nr:protein-L-isoaspartate O-methyltransferase [Paracoccaceae bacterium]